MIADGAIPALFERFWLCDNCSKTMTVIWAGTHAKLVPLPAKPVEIPAVLSVKAVPNERLRKRAARAASRSR